MRAYSFYSDNVINRMTECGGFIYMVGLNETDGIGNITLSKWDFDGHNLWNSTWGGFWLEYSIGIWSDGTYIYTCGATYVDELPYSHSDLLLLKWNSQGGIEWSATWDGTGDPAYDRGKAIWGNGTDVFVLGDTIGYSGSDFVLVQFRASDGLVGWNSTWGGGKEDVAEGLWGNGYFVWAVGTTSSFGSGAEDVAIVKWNTATAEKVWNATAGSSVSDFGYGIWGEDTLPYIYTVGEIAGDQWIIKWDDNGQVMDDNYRWYQETAGVNSGRAITGNGTVLYTCGASGIGGDGGAWDVTLVEWDLDLNILANRTWGYPNSGEQGEIGYSIWCNDTDIVLAGMCLSMLGELYRGDCFIVRWSAGEAPPAPTPPNSPVILTASQTIQKDYIDVRWQEVSGAQSYRIYVNSILKVTVSSASSRTGPSATINGNAFAGIITTQGVGEKEQRVELGGNGQYKIKITAINDGGESDMSSAIIITVQLGGGGNPTLIDPGMLATLGFLGGGIGLVAGYVLNDSIVQQIRGRRNQRRKRPGRIKSARNLETRRKRPGRIKSARNPETQRKRPGRIKSARQLGASEDITVGQQVARVPVISDAEAANMLADLMKWWDTLPKELTDWLMKVVEKYMKLADQATLLLLTQYQNIANTFFDACKTYRFGDLQASLSKLDTVKENAAKEKFGDIVEEVKVIHGELTLKIEGTLGGDVPQ